MQKHIVLLFWLVLIVLNAGVASVDGFRLPDWVRRIAARGRLEESSSGDVLPDFRDADDPNVKAHWALLIAGSAGWYNYRHQADVCHAYHVLRTGGLEEKRIVVMMYDDIADNPENPYPGQIFNRPGGPDVYKGVPKDYTGEQVNAETFLSVLLGDKAAVANKGSGKVIQSGPEDRVFVFYSDHGATGVLGMPSGPFLYADQLQKTLQNKLSNGGFKEMVLYIEACESGSMFEGLLDSNSNIYVTTAANAYESSWATYCPGMSGDYDEEISTCLGDLYSVAWMENSDEADLTHETLHKQYKLVKKRTSNNYTYTQGSHVMQYGAVEMDSELAGSYLGMENNGTAPMVMTASWPDKGRLNRFRSSMKQRDADLVPAVYKYKSATSPEEKQRAYEHLQAELQQRNALDASVEKTVRRLLMQNNGLSLALMMRLPGGGQQIPWSTNNVQSDSLYLNRPTDIQLTNLLISEKPFSQPGKPHVQSWACLRGMVEVWEEKCGQLGDYGMQYTRLFTNLCNAHVAPEDFSRSMDSRDCNLQSVS